MKTLVLILIMSVVVTACKTKIITPKQDMTADQIDISQDDVEYDAVIESDGPVDNENGVTN